MASGSVISINIFAVNCKVLYASYWHNVYIWELKKKLNWIKSNNIGTYDMTHTTQHTHHTGRKIMLLYEYNTYR